MTGGWTMEGASGTVSGPMAVKRPHVFVSSYLPVGTGVAVRAARTMAATLINQPRGH